MKEWLAEYTVEMFTKRNDTLTREMRKLQASEADLLKKQSSQSDIKNAEAEIIPTTQRILDSYSRLSVPEKNSCNSSALHLLARLQRTRRCKASALCGFGQKNSYESKLSTSFSDRIPARLNCYE